MNEEQRIMAEYHGLLNLAFHELSKRAEESGDEPPFIYQCASCQAWTSNDTRHRHASFDVEDRVEAIADQEVEISQRIVEIDWRIKEIATRINYSTNGPVGSYEQAKELALLAMEKKTLVKDKE